MASLPAGVSFASLARILTGGRALGHDAWSGGGPPVPSESQLSTDIEELLRILQERDIRYLLVGGVALLKYVRGRNTEDIDLLLSTRSLASLPELTIEDRNAYFALAKFRSLRVDLLFTANALFKSVSESQAATHRFGGIEVPCATPAGLTLLKLYALPALYRQGDLERAALYENDVATLSLGYPNDLGTLVAELKPHLTPAELADVGAIAQEISARVDRMRRSSPQ